MAFPCALWHVYRCWFSLVICADLGFPNDPKLVKSAFEKKNSITIVAAPTGAGKTTTLYSILDYLDKPEINVTTIEDPVEIRIPGLNQICFLYTADLFYFLL